jgi:1,4-alpha-glucan branching enzyme
LSKGNRGFRTTYLLVALLFFGAGFPACMTVPKASESEDGAVVTFVFIGSHDSVCLSGDFNGWSAESNCLERKGDQWSVRLVLSPGTYRYGFVIDKRDWVCDPEALIQEDDGFGKKNSVLLITPTVTKRPAAP